MSMYASFGNEAVALRDAYVSRLQNMTEVRFHDELLPIACHRPSFQLAHPVSTQNNV